MILARTGRFMRIWIQLCSTKCPLRSSTVRFTIFATKRQILISKILDITSSITYNSTAPLSEPSFTDDYSDMNDTSLVPVVVEPMLPVDRTIELEVSFNTMSDGTNRAMFNQVSYLAPLVPTTLSVLTLGSNATNSTAYGYSGFVLDHLSAIQIILKNGDVGNHPLYAQLFSVRSIIVS